MTMEYEIHCSFYIFINIYLYDNYEPYDTGFYLSSSMIKCSGYVDLWQQWLIMTNTKPFCLSQYLLK